MRMRARTVGSITPSSSSCIGAGASCSSSSSSWSSFLVALASSVPSFQAVAPATPRGARTRRQPRRCVSYEPRCAPFGGRCQRAPASGRSFSELHPPCSPTSPKDSGGAPAPPRRHHFGGRERALPLLRLRAPRWSPASLRLRRRARRRRGPLARGGGDGGREGRGRRRGGALARAARRPPSRLAPTSLPAPPRRCSTRRRRLGGGGVEVAGGHTVVRQKINELRSRWNPPTSSSGSPPPTRGRPTRSSSCRRRSSGAELSARLGRLLPRLLRRRRPRLGRPATGFGFGFGIGIGFGFGLPRSASLSAHSCATSSSSWQCPCRAGATKSRLR